MRRCRCLQLYLAHASLRAYAMCGSKCGSSCSRSLSLLLLSAPCALRAHNTALTPSLSNNAMRNRPQAVESDTVRMQLKLCFAAAGGA